MISPKFNAKDFTIKLKATIQRSGKLGFTSDTIQPRNVGLAGNADTMEWLFN